MGVRMHGADYVVHGLVVRLTAVAGLSVAKSNHRGTEYTEEDTKRLLVMIYFIYNQTILRTIIQ